MHVTAVWTGTLLKASSTFTLWALVSSSPVTATSVFGKMYVPVHGGMKLLATCSADDESAALPSPD